MRVLQVVTDNDRRGAQVFGAHLHDALRARGHDVETVAMVEGASGGLGFPVLGRRWPSPTILRRLRARMGGADVTVAHGSDTGLACALAGIGRRRYVYRQISDSAFWTPTRLKRARSRFGMNRAAAVVALSEFNRTQLVETIGVEPGKIVVVPNGVPGSRFTPPTAEERRAARVALGVPDGPIVLSVGALTPEKGTALVVAAVARIPDVHLVVAGAGPERERLEAQARAEAPERVHFVGNRPDAGELYRAADVLALASRGGDSMPAVLLEAGLCALATVSTRIGAIPEVIVDGSTGLVVDPDDPVALAEAVTALLGDPPRRARMGAAARERCLTRYEMTPVAEEWESVLRRVARTGSVSRRR